MLSLLIVCQISTSSAEVEETVPDGFSGGCPLRRQLQLTGVSPFAALTTEAWANVAGGLQKGIWWNQLLDFGLELDTEKMGGWAGGSFLAQAHWVANSQRNSNFAEYTGALNPVSGLMASDHLRVFNLFYRQSWNQDAVVVKLGQLAIDDDFMLSRYTGLFANSAFGPMPSQVGNRLASCCGFSPPFPMYSVAAPGAFLSLRLFEGGSIQAGVYDGLPGEDTPDNHGFAWVGQNHFEAALFSEAAFDYRLSERAATLRLGTSYHTGPLESFPHSAGEVEDDTRQAVPNFYAVHDLELARSSEGKPVLGLFYRAGITPTSNAAWWDITRTQE